VGVLQYPLFLKCQLAICAVLSIQKMEIGTELVCWEREDNFYRYSAN